MGERFEVGLVYEASDPGMPNITVLRRTDKTVWVDNGQSRWAMRVKHDPDDNEMLIDSSVPKSWQGAFMYKATWLYE